MPCVIPKTTSNSHIVSNLETTTKSDKAFKIIIKATQEKKRRKSSNFGTSPLSEIRLLSKRYRYLLPTSISQLIVIIRQKLSFQSFLMDLLSPKRYILFFCLTVCCCVFLLSDVVLCCLVLLICCRFCISLISIRFFLQSYVSQGRLDYWFVVYSGGYEKRGHGNLAKKGMVSVRHFYFLL